MSLLFCFEWEDNILMKFWRNNDYGNFGDNDIHVAICILSKEDQILDMA